MRTAVALVLFSAACSGARQPQRSVARIGELLDRTGSIATPSWSESVRLAVQTVNDALARSGHPGWRFEIKAADSANRPAAAREGAVQLVERDGVKAIVTDSTRDAVAVNEAFEEGAALAVPVVCMACNAPLVAVPPGRTGWSFRTSASDAYVARALASLLVERAHGGPLKVAIYAAADPDGRGLSDALEWLIVERRPDARVVRIFHAAGGDSGGDDWAADVARILAGSPGVVVEATFPRLAVGFMKAWVDSATDVPIVHVHGFRSARVLDTLNVSIEGHEGISQAVLGDGPSAQPFARDLEALTARPPAPGDAAAYDAAAMLMLAAIRAAHALHVDLAQVPPWGIRDSMRAVSDKAGETVYGGVDGIAKAIRQIDVGKPIDYSGASGPCDFDANGDVLPQLSRYRVQDGRFADIEKLDCVPGGDCAPRAALAAGR